MEEEQFLLSIGSVVREPVGGTYVVEALLGQGGFGAVYLVRERHNTQQVFALKEETNPNRYRRASFSVEADILRRLQHPALPRVYRVFEDVQRQRSYMLMEYIAGQNLDALRRAQPEQRFALPQALELLAPIVDALNYLHHQEPPIVHRDIKPANIIVPGSHAAMLVDFGLAKEFVEDRTTNAVRPATPGYAAPEQYSGGTGPGTDIYSLGATCYTLLTGQVPPHALRRAISKENDLLQPAHELVPAVPEKVARTLARAMAIHREDRYETIEQFWQELRSQTAAQPAPPARKKLPEPLLSPSERRSQNQPRAFLQTLRSGLRGRRGIALAVLALLLLLMVAGGASALMARSPQPRASGNGTPIVTPSQAVSPGACGEPSATPSLSRPAQASASYPSLAPSYAGTIYDNLTTQQTALCLLNIQQTENKIQGTLQGLGLVGTFQGTVTSDNKISFTMPLYSGTEKLVCTGVIKVAGDMTGTFQIYDQQGNTTGESGAWNVSVYKQDTR